MMYRLFANIEFTNGDFERRLLNNYIHLKEGTDMLKLDEHHWGIVSVIMMVLKV